jgi:hypothetical protein
MMTNKDPIHDGELAARILEHRRSGAVPDDRSWPYEGKDDARP